VLQPRNLAIKEDTLSCVKTRLLLILDTRNKERVNAILSSKSREHEDKTGKTIDLGVALHNNGEK
jgi:hypothetical protein